MFFHYRQNNSSGWFKIDADAGISVNVIIEAKNAHWANQTARDLGLYFDGVDYDIDCGCCGDRWDRAYSDGDEVPSIYGRSVYDPQATISSRWAGDQPEGFIHYMDGTIEALWGEKLADDPEDYWGEYSVRVTPWPYVESQVSGPELT